MTRYIPDDRRYMSHEIRAIDDARYRGKVAITRPEVVTCYCGKTVIEARGVATGWTCPRECEARRPRRGDVVVTSMPERARAMGFVPHIDVGR